MGLVSSDHPEELNKDLNNHILDTFALIIINEYDQMNGKKFKPEDVKSGTYMATRYLQ